MRYHIRIYRGHEPGLFRAELEEAANSLGAKINWDVPGKGETLFRVSHHNGVHSVYLAESSPIEDTIYEAIGRVTGLPWLYLRIPGAPLWCYSLYLGGEKKDEFCPCPELWWTAGALSLAERKRLARQSQGNPQLLSELWQVPFQRIDRYLRLWGLTKSGGTKFKLNGKAYPDDEYTYGRSEQLIDFWRAIGGGLLSEVEHSLTVR